MFIRVKWEDIYFQLPTPTLKKEEVIYPTVFFCLRKVKLGKMPQSTKRTSIMHINIVTKRTLRTRQQTTWLAPTNVYRV